MPTVSQSKHNKSKQVWRKRAEKLPVSEESFCKAPDNGSYVR